jgi:hypothetical protein
MCFRGRGIERRRGGRHYHITSVFIHVAGLRGYELGRTYRQASAQVFAPVPQFATQLLPQAWQM